MSVNKEEIENYLKGLQDDISMALEKEDGRAAFQEDNWERPGGGGGRSRVIESGNTFEKGGVNFSAVHGKTPEKILKSLNLSESDFYATGVSLVIHPQNPRVPIVHMNVRYFEMSNGTWWFGGGIDLTPVYVVPEEAKFFHTTLKEACDKHDPSYYQRFKEWADEYFFIKHRNETRGIGGIFFDRLSEQEKDKDTLFGFLKSVGNTFNKVYLPLVRENKDLEFSEKEKEWQLVRRGRYAEFNLVYDKGTKFGLDTGGRIESILMSLPPQAEWKYNYQTQPGSEEERTLKYLKKGINWI